jgi:hypothetical protein
MTYALMASMDVMGEGTQKWSAGWNDPTKSSMVNDNVGARGEEEGRRALVWHMPRGFKFRLHPGSRQQGGGALPEMEGP